MPEHFCKKSKEFRSTSEEGRLNVTLMKHCFSSKRHPRNVECSFENPGGTFPKLSTKNSPMSKNQNKKSNHFSRKMFLRTPRVQFWQPCQKNFAKIEKKSAWIQKRTLKKNFYQKKLFVLQSYSGHIECISDNPVRKISPWTWKISVWNPKKILIIYVF